MPSSEGVMVGVEDTTAYGRNSQCFAKGIPPATVINRYSTWATEYNTMMAPGRYNGPIMAAEEITRMFEPKSRPHARILDVAAGTGLVGLQLKSRGFGLLDALEPSEGMMKVLERTGAYGKTIQEFLGDENSSLPNDEYDVTVVVGAFGEGHIPVQGVDELIRVTKPGGVVVNVMRLEYLETVEMYRGKLEPYFDLMERKGYWKQVARKVVPNYFCLKDGVIYIHKIL